MNSENNLEPKPAQRTTVNKLTDFLRKPVIAGGVFVLLLGITGLFIFSRNKSKLSDQERHEKTLQTVDRQSAAQNYDGSIEELSIALDGAEDPSTRYQYMGRLATNYYNKEDWENAIYWYEQAQATGQPGAENFSLEIAISAENMGDNEKAIEHYQKIVDLLKAQPGNLAKSRAANYETKIKKLGGTPR